MAGEKPSSEARRARLAKALKANIAKRKLQARSRDAEPPAEGAAEIPPEEDGCPN